VLNCSSRGNRTHHSPFGLRDFKSLVSWTTIVFATKYMKFCIMLDVPTLTIVFVCGLESILALDFP